VTVEDCVEPLRRMTDPGAMADMVATMLLPDGAKRQVILQAVGVEERLKHLVRLLSAEVTRAKKA
jgi:ATP-dependent Lon protease